jgi:hypothetical protein
MRVGLSWTCTLHVDKFVPVPVNCLTSWYGISFTNAGGGRGWEANRRGVGGGSKLQELSQLLTVNWIKPCRIGFT